MSKRPEDYDGGLQVSKQLLRILNQPGFVSVRMGGQRAREIYRTGTLSLDCRRLSPFGLACFVGQVDAVREKVDSGEAPPLDSTETPYKWGYTTVILCGAQQIRGLQGATLRHLDTLKYLISKGLPVDLPDIAGWTALSHAAMAVISQVEITEALLEAGANPNHQGRYGDVPLINAFQANKVKETDLLLEYGADLDIPEADGHTPRKFFLQCGPQITAVVQKHIQKRAGKEAPRTTKQCDNCHKEDLPLKNCAKCQVARYCGTECQRAAWPTHKKSCQPFSQATTLTFKPYYGEYESTIPAAAFVRQRLGTNHGQTPATRLRANHVPKEVLAGKSKPIVIKVQVQMGGGTGPMFVYDKKRDFACTLHREDGATSYDQLARTVREKGVGGLKAYFAAELKSKDELIVKVSEVLAEQPF